MSRLALSLVELRTEFDHLYPNRDRASDGTIGDAAHRATWSDHNPNSEGVICAMDVDTDLDGTNDNNDAQMDAIVERIRLNPHQDLKYVIYQGQIASAYAAHGFNPWDWRPYTGDSHVSHPHFSVGDGPDGRSAPGTYDHTDSWGIIPSPIVQQLTEGFDMAHLMVDPKGRLYIVENELTGKVYVPVKELVPDIVYWLEHGKALILPPDGQNVEKLWGDKATKITSQAFMDLIPTR